MCGINGFNFKDENLINQMMSLHHSEAQMDLKPTLMIKFRFRTIDSQ